MIVRDKIILSLSRKFFEFSKLFSLSLYSKIFFLNADKYSGFGSNYNSRALINLHLEDSLLEHQTPSVEIFRLVGLNSLLLLLLLSQTLLVFVLDLPVLDLKRIWNFDRSVDEENRNETRGNKNVKPFVSSCKFPDPSILSALRSSLNRIAPFAFEIQPCIFVSSTRRSTRFLRQSVLIDQN